MTIEKKYDALQKIFKDLGKVIVAYSGGVDSTFLLKTAVDTLGSDNVLACIATGPTQPGAQFRAAAELAGKIGVQLLAVRPDELADKNFTANKPDRCFHCKSNICQKLLDIAGEKGFDNVIFGTNADDTHDYRPGSRAIRLHNIRCPLAEAALTKKEIRQLSRQLDLPTADQPANPCLVSRLEYGLPITEQRLKQIDEAEDFLRSFGLVEFRVRHHETIARIEVCPEDMDTVMKETNRSKIIEKLKSMGFKYVTVDLQGFRSGSLNESLTEEEKKKNL